MTIFAGDIPELVNQSFGAVVTFAGRRAERAMYFGSPVFNGGHESAGATGPRRTGSWRRARPAASSPRSAAPTPTPRAHVTLTYLREGGGT